MTVYRYEIRKLLRSRFIGILFLLCALLSFVLSFRTAKPSPMQDALLHAYDAWLEDPQGTADYRKELDRYLREHIMDGELHFPCTYDTSRQSDDMAVLRKLYERVDYLTGHEKKIAGIVSSAEGRAADLRYFGFPESGFTVRAQEALAACYRPLTGEVTGQTGYAYGYDRYLENPVLPFLLLLFLTAGTAYIFRSDAVCGMYSVIRTCRKGGTAAGLAKVGAVLTLCVVTVFVFSGVSLAGVWLSGGLSSPFLPIQAFPAYYAVPFRGTILLYLFLHLALRTAAFAAYCAFLSLAASLKLPYAGCFGAGILFCGGNLFLYCRHYTGTVPAIRYLNLASLADVTGLTGFYRTVSLFGKPVSHIGVTVVLALLFSLLLYGAAVPLYRLRPVVSVRRGVLSGRLRKASAGGRETEKRERCIRSGLFSAELKKNRIPLILCLALLLLCGRYLTVRKDVGDMKQYREARYYRYITGLRGLPEEEIPAYMEEIQDGIDDVFRRCAEVKKAYEAGQVSHTEYYACLSAYDEAMAENLVFADVKSYADYITHKNAVTGRKGQIIYTSGYERYFGLGSDLLLAVLLVLLCAGSFSVEYRGTVSRSGFAPILRTTKYGRTRTFCVKMGICMGLGGVFSLLFRLVSYLAAKNGFVMENTDALLYSIPYFSGVSSAVTVKQFLIADFVLQFFAGALFSGVLCGISAYCKKTLPCFSAAALLLTVPEVLVRTVFPSVPMISPLSFTVPQTCLRYASGGAVLTYFLIAAVIMAAWILSAGVFFDGTHIRRKAVRKHDAAIPEH